MSGQVTDSPDDKDEELEDVTPTCSDAHVLGDHDNTSEKELRDDSTNCAPSQAAGSNIDQSCKIVAEIKKNKIDQANNVNESSDECRDVATDDSSDISSAIASPEYATSTSSDSPLNTLTEPGQDAARVNQVIENINFVDDGSSLEDLRQGKGYLPCGHIESPGSDDSEDRAMGGASRPHSLSFPQPLKSIQGRRSRSSELSQLVRDYQDSSMGMSQSLPQHGMLSKNTELTEFTASDLQAMIMRSSPMSKTDSSSMGSRTSSVRSITSASSSTSMGTSFTTSGMSCSPSSLMQQSPDDIPPIDPQIILDLENQARRVTVNLDHLMGNLKSNLHKVQQMSAITVGCLEAYSSSVDATCDSVDGSIKSMYALMAKCEELSKNMHPVYQLADQIKEIKRLMDRFEGQIDAQSSS